MIAKGLQVLPVNVIFLILSITIYLYFFTLLHDKHLLVLSKTIMVIIVTFIIIAKPTQNLTSFLLPAHKYYST